MKKPSRQRRQVEDTSVKVLCCTCSKWFQTPRQCLDCSNWNVCLPCLEKESQEIRQKLAARGIILS